MLLVNNQLIVQTKLHTFQNVSGWMDVFINYVIIYIHQHPDLTSRIMSLICSLDMLAAANRLHKWLSYTKQLCLMTLYEFGTKLMV